MRRFATVLFLPLGLQLVLSARAIACVGQAAASNASVQSASDMRGMDMPGSASGKMTPNKAPAEPSRQSPRPPCDRPFGPGDCQPLAACASGALTPVLFHGPANEAPDRTRITLVVLAPASRTTAPEPPPPKA